MAIKKISLDELNDMVGTCLDMVLNEYHHTIDYQYGTDIETIARCVSIMFGDNFTIPEHLVTVNGKPLNINFYQPKREQEFAGYDISTNTLHISKSIPNDYKFIKQLVSHEMSHIVDKQKRTKEDFDTDGAIDTYTIDDSKSFNEAKFIITFYHFFNQTYM